MVRLRTYGSMTYAGLLSLIYADVDRKDPRVQSAVDWAANHWTLDENPGMGDEGLFYFYNILGKALDAFGSDTIVQEGKEPVRWREDLVRKLVSLQKRDKKDPDKGFWVNTNNRFWEKDRVLVTAYTIITLNKALPE